MLGLFAKISNSLKENKQRQQDDERRRQNLIDIKRQVRYNKYLVDLCEKNFYGIDISVEQIRWTNNRYTSGYNLIMSIFDYIIRNYTNYVVIDKLFDMYPNKLNDDTLIIIIQTNQMDIAQKISLIQKIVNNGNLGNFRKSLLKIFINNDDVLNKHKIELIDIVRPFGDSEYNDRVVEIVIKTLSSIMEHISEIDKIISHVEKLVINDETNTLSIKTKFEIINKTVFNVQHISSKNKVKLVNTIMNLMLELGNLEYLTINTSDFTIITYYVWITYCGIKPEHIDKNSLNSMDFLYENFKNCPRRYFTVFFDKYMIPNGKTINELKNYAIKKTLETNDYAFIEYLLTIETFNLDFLITSNAHNWYYVFLQNVNASFDQKITFLLYLRDIKKLDSNFAIEFYNVSLDASNPLLFYDNIVELLNKFMKFNKKGFDFIHHKDANGKNLMTVLNKINYQKPLSIIKMYDVNEDDLDDDQHNNSNNCSVCMNSTVNVCIKHCGHTLCSDCANNLNKCPMCTKDYVPSDLVKIYLS